MRDTRAQVARRVDGIAGRPAERDPYSPNQAPHEIGAEPGGWSGGGHALREDGADNEDEDEGTDHFAQQVRDELSDGGRGTEARALQGGVWCFFPVRQVVDPYQRSTGNGAEQLGHEIG